MRNLLLSGALGLSVRGGGAAHADNNVAPTSTSAARATVSAYIGEVSAELRSQPLFYPSAARARGVVGNRVFPCEVIDRAQDASCEALPSALGEEAFHGIEPGAGEVGGWKWNVHRGCSASQASTRGCFMGGIIVEDGVDHLAGRDGPLDGCDEADELLMPMARHAAADDLAFEHAGERRTGSSCRGVCNRA